MKAQPDISETHDVVMGEGGRLFESADLMRRIARETEGLKFLLAQVEDGIFGAFEDNGMKIDGEVAASLQQLDLAIQTAVCIVDVLNAGAENQHDDGHDVENALARLGLRDLAERLASG